MVLTRMKKIIICVVVLIVVGIVFYAIRQKYLDSHLVMNNYKVIEKNFLAKKSDYDLIIAYLKEKQPDCQTTDARQELVKIYIEANDLKIDVESELNESLIHFDANDYNNSITATYRWSIEGYQLVLVDFPLKNEKTQNIQFWLRWQDTKYEDKLSASLHPIEDRWYIRFWGYGY